jgi:hypothetical protein
VHSYRGRRTLLEASPSVPGSQAGTQVAHKRAASLCIPRGAASPFLSSAVPAIGAATTNLGSDRPISPASAPTAFSCTYCCSPSCSRDPPSSHLAGTPAPAATAAWRRGPPLPATFLHQPSPQNVLQRAPSQPPRLPRPSRATSLPELRRPRRPPPLGATLRGGNSF